MTELLVAAAILIGGQYANTDLHQWFESLRSGNGKACCALSDGRTIQSPDWEFDGHNFKVKINEDWMIVPPEAVISVKNLYGQAVVWIVWMDGKPEILCFIPGAMT